MSKRKKKEKEESNTTSEWFMIIKINRTNSPSSSKTRTQTTENKYKKISDTDFNHIVNKMGLKFFDWYNSLTLDPQTGEILDFKGKIQERTANSDSPGVPQLLIEHFESQFNEYLEQEKIKLTSEQQNTLKTKLSTPIYIEAFRSIVIKFRTFFLNNYRNTKISPLCLYDALDVANALPSPKNNENISKILEWYIESIYFNVRRSINKRPKESKERVHDSLKEELNHLKDNKKYNYSRKSIPSEILDPLIENALVTFNKTVNLPDLKSLIAKEIENLLKSLTVDEKTGEISNLKEKIKEHSANSDSPSIGHSLLELLQSKINECLGKNETELTNKKHDVLEYIPESYLTIYIGALLVQYNSISCNCHDSEVLETCLRNALDLITVFHLGNSFQSVISSVVQACANSIENKWTEIAETRIKNELKNFSKELSEFTSKGENINEFHYKNSASIKAIVQACHDGIKNDIKQLMETNPSLDKTSMGYFYISTLPKSFDNSLNELLKKLAPQPTDLKK